MSEKLIDRITASISRRGFLGTLSAASAAFIVGLFKIQGASASGIPCQPGLFTVGCCCLFKDPRTCSYSDCGCEWVWTCIEGGGFAPITESGGNGQGHGRGQGAGGPAPLLPVDPVPCRRYSCRECYIDPNPNQSCTGAVKCSKATFTTIWCAG